MNMDMMAVYLLRNRDEMVFNASLCLELHSVKWDTFYTSGFTVS